MAIAGLSVVDAHTHVFPPEVSRGRDTIAAREPWFDLLYREPRAAMIAADELLVAMDEAGVDQAIQCGFPWLDPGLCRLHNDYMADAAARSQGRLAWLATVPPVLGSEAADEATRAFALGAVGLGELNADAQGFDLAAPDTLAAVVTVCQTHDRPLLLHTSEPVGHHYPGKGTTTPDRVLVFLRTYPSVRVALAHWGGGLPFYELMPEVATATAGVVYDSAASTYLYRAPVFRSVIDVVGRERVLFGSDHPVLRMDRFLRRVVSTSGLRPEELAPVLGDNARRFYGLPTLAAAAPTAARGKAGMIAGLRGRLDAKLADALLVDVGGIIYRVYTSGSTLDEVGEVGDSVRLQTHLFVREDQLTLYGFAGSGELRLFETLIGVTGVGPRLACAILSRFQVEALHQAITGENTDLLATVPGVGKKTAARLILELRGKLVPAGPLPSSGRVSREDADVVEALRALGFTAAEAHEATARLPRDGGLTVEERVVAALRELGSG